MTAGASDDAGGSPWAHDVPVPAAPAEFTWARQGEREVESLGTGIKDRIGETRVAVEPSQTTVEAEGRPALLSPLLSPVLRSERGRWVVGSIAGVILLVLGWLVVGRGSGNDDLGATDPSTPVGTTAGTGVENSLPTADEPVAVEPADDPGAGSSVGTRSNDESEWREDVVDLPQVFLDSSTPFDIVALTSVGDYVEVAIPSGRVNLMEVGRGLDGRVVAGDTATLFISYSSTQGGRLLRDGEPSIELPLPSNIDISQVEAVGDDFVGVSLGNNGEQSLVTVLANGGVVTSSIDDAEFNIWQRRIAPDGSTLVTEAGGVYREVPDGFERISTGALISASTNHVLVRECDETMACGYVTIEFKTGERVEAVIADDGLESFGFDSAQVSPDGRWLRYVAYRGDASDEILIDLTTGARTGLDFNIFGTGGSVWAADSSGFFRLSLSAGFEFYAVATGETITFGEQLGRMVSFDTRISPGAPEVPTRTLTATGVHLIALTASGDVAHIDVDAGTVVITDGPGIDSRAPVTIFPDAAGATFTAYGNVPSMQFIADAGSAVEVAGPSPSGPVWPGPTAGSVWQLAQSDDATVLALDLVDVHGNELGTTIEFGAIGPNGVVGSDGRGGVLIKPKLGGVFALDAMNPPERITNGELLAIDANVAYVRECDDTLQCGAFAVDRATGNRSSVDHTGFSRAGAIGSRGVPAGQNVSPDGTIAFVRDGDDPTRCIMIDTTAGRDSWTGVPCVDVASPIIWTPDSAAALWLADGRVTIYERSTRSVRLVSTVKLSAIAAVPADADVGS